jgi:hypothetical protein
MVPQSGSFRTEFPVPPWHAETNPVASTWHCKGASGELLPENVIVPVSVTDGPDWFTVMTALPSTRRELLTSQ